jgi:hypothetical protein
MALTDEALDNARTSIGLEFQALIQNVRAVKPTHLIVAAFPDIHYHINNGIARRNWLVHDYETTAPIKWDDIAESIFEDIPIMEIAIEAALNADGY